ncbi:hypothetical protein EZ444_04095 [Pedobacter hiemivivus]|uniref:Uncharacterized protein n=1 Tax=Pedobacter hiemivivus TaxID=2530454 RepID=A0A4R0NEJ3_9SPHI|nr:hypothetical protein EZ444_04095 [Pedobacter hiemivivus]
MLYFKVNKIVRRIINQLTDKPRVLFLIDGLGALLTAFFLFVVLRNFNDYVGMPIWILNSLSLIAVCFCVYSAACFFFLKQHWTPFIIGIGMANLLYCVLTFGILIIHFPIISIAGIAYFLVEIVLICGLVYIELKVAKTIRKKKMELC